VQKGGAYFVEVAELSEHRANSCHLEHQPLNGMNALNRVGRKQFRLGFLGQVNQNGTTFKDTDWLSIFKKINKCKIIECIKEK